MKRTVGGCASRILLCFTPFLLYRSGNSTLLLRHGIYPILVISAVKLATDKLTNKKKSVFSITLRKGAIWLSYTSVLLTDDLPGYYQSQRFSF